MAAPRKPPFLVWLVVAYFLYSAGVVAVTYLRIAIGEQFPPGQRQYLTSPVVWQSNLVVCILTSIAAVALLRRHRSAFYLAAFAIIIDSITLIYTVIAMHAQLLPGGSATIEFAIGNALNTGSVLYLWFLARSGFLAPVRLGPIRGLFATHESPQPLRNFVQGALAFLLGSGVLWPIMECRAHKQSEALDRLRTINDLYARQQQLNAEVSPLLPTYILERDTEARAEAWEPGWPESVAMARYGKRIEFDALLSRMTTLVIQYNHIEYALANLERRPPRWFPLPIPLGPVTNLHVEPVGDGKQGRIVFNLPKRDRLQADVQQDIRVLIAHPPSK